MRQGKLIKRLSFAIFCNNAIYSSLKKDMIVWSKKYITINDKEVVVNIPSVEDDITICLLSNQKFQ